jgi:hypothetical protein
VIITGYTDVPHFQQKKQKNGPANNPSCIGGNHLFMGMAYCDKSARYKEKTYGKAVQTSLKMCPLPAIDDIRNNHEKQEDREKKPDKKIRVTTKDPCHHALAATDFHKHPAKQNRHGQCRIPFPEKGCSEAKTKKVERPKRRFLF